MKDLFALLNPVQNAQILAEINEGQHKYTMTLGRREYETTNSDAAWSFIYAFTGEGGEPFKMSSKPYAGAEINSVVNTKQ